MRNEQKKSSEEKNKSEDDIKPVKALQIVDQLIRGVLRQQDEERLIVTAAYGPRYWWDTGDSWTRP